MTDPREPLGRLVHEQRLACEAERAAAEGRERFHLKPWEQRTYEQQETDMRIGAAVAAAEREQVIQLAAESGATCIAQGGVEIPFADLIRESNDG